MAFEGGFTGIFGDLLSKAADVAEDVIRKREGVEGGADPTPTPPDEAAAQRAHEAQMAQIHATGEIATTEARSKWLIAGGVFLLGFFVAAPAIKELLK